MNNILKFESFIKEAYLHTEWSTINEIVDLRDYDFLYKETKESVKEVNKFLENTRQNDEMIQRINILILEVDKVLA